jgi:hypothetical protein
MGNSEDILEKNFEYIFGGLDALSKQIPERCLDIVQSLWVK